MDAVRSNFQRNLMMVCRDDGNTGMQCRGDGVHEMNEKVWISKIGEKNLNASDQ